MCLLEQAGSKKWSVKVLQQERDKLLGKPDKIKVVEYDDRVNQVVDQLPANIEHGMQWAIGD
jgi:hypothetical protein